MGEVWWQVVFLFSGPPEVVVCFGGMTHADAGPEAVRFVFLQDSVPLIFLCLLRVVVAVVCLLRLLRDFRDCRLEGRSRVDAVLTTRRRHAARVRGACRAARVPPKPRFPVAATRKEPCSVKADSNDAVSKLYAAPRR